MPPCKMQSAKAKHKVLDEITGFARSRHPVKVYCYQWTTSNYKWRAMLPPGRSLAPACDCSLPLFPKAILPVSKKKERASDHLAIQQFTKAHSGCSPSLSYCITASLPCQQFSQTFSSLPHRKIQRLHTIVGGGLEHLLHQL